MGRRRTGTGWVIACLLLTLGLAACVGPEERMEEQDRLSWWREARFGLFIHWGLYSIPAGRWGEETGHAEWIRDTARIPVGEYDRLRERFDPAAYDPDRWCRLAKAAGMKYVVITSKHHDGFCLWDSAETDFDVASTPHGRDLLGPLEAACRAYGLRFGLYHSIMDWHHPDYLPRRRWEREARPVGDADFERYVAYLGAQVRELATRYPDLSLLWFDGQWERTWNHARGRALYDLCLSMRPGLIVNDRVDVGRLGHSGRIAEGYAGDYGTPEQTVPKEKLAGLDWESCITMNRHWGWNEADEEWKSAGELIRTLIDVVSRNGNLLLNVGPRADGSFPPEAASRLTAIGVWMDRNREAIHGCGAAPFAEPSWGRLTWRRRGTGSTLYLHVFEPPPDGVLSLADVGNEVERAFEMGAGETALRLRRDGDELKIELPATGTSTTPRVVAIRLRGAPLVYRAPVIEAASDLFVTSTLVRLDVPAGLEARYEIGRASPTGASKLYAGPFRLDRAAVVSAQTFHGERPVGPMASRKFRKVEPRPATTVSEPKPGLRCRVYAGSFDVLPDFDALEPEARTVRARVDLGEKPEREFVARVFEGYFEVGADDVYAFSLSSDDGSRLTIGSEVVIDNDGLHGPREMRGFAPLSRGLHPIRVEFFNKTGGAALELRVARAGRPLSEIAADRLFH